MNDYAIVFQVISGHRRVEEDSYEGGCVPGTSQCMDLCDRNNRQYKSLEDLLEDIGDFYALPDNFLDWEYSYKDKSTIELIHSNLENEDNWVIKQETQEYKDWEKGRIKAWSVEYVFVVKKLRIETVEFNETDFGKMRCSD